MLTHYGPRLYCDVVVVVVLVVVVDCIVVVDDGVMHGDGSKR